MIECGGNMSINSNTRGIPYIKTNSVAVKEDVVEFSLGFRIIPKIGYMTINIQNAIPEGTETTLPISLVLNGNSRQITLFGGNNLTVSDLTGLGVIILFYDWFEGLLQLVSYIPLTTAATQTT